MPWLGALASGVLVPFPLFLGMRLRRTPVRLIFDTHVAFAKRGQPMDLGVIEAAYLVHRSEIKTEQDLVRAIMAARD